jgi:hypothetical protein
MLPAHFFTFFLKLFQFSVENIFSGENYFCFGENCCSFWQKIFFLGKTISVLVKTVSVFGKLLKTWRELKRFWWKLLQFLAENIFSRENYFGFGENCFTFRKTF